MQHRDGARTVILEDGRFEVTRDREGYFFFSRYGKHDHTLQDIYEYSDLVHALAERVIELEDAFEEIRPQLRQAQRS